MSEPPIASVVIPTYNSADSVTDSIRSTLNQSIPDLEVIVVDDASTDDTEEEVAGIPDDRVTYIAHSENRGGSAARNTGIEKADGKYVAFLDADDEWFPSKLEQQINDLEQRSDSWIASYCGVKGVPNRSIARKLAFTVFSDISYGNEGGEELIPLVLTNRFYLGGASVLMAERDVLEEMNGFDERFDSLQDMEFLIRLLQHGKLAYVDNDLVEKHFTGYGVDTQELIETRKLYLKKFSKEVIELEMDGKRVLAIHRFDFSKFYFMEGDILNGFRTLVKSKASQPTDYFGLVQAIIQGLTNPP